MADRVCCTFVTLSVLYSVQIDVTGEPCPYKANDPVRKKEVPLWVRTVIMRKREKQRFQGRK